MSMCTYFISMLCSVHVFCTTAVCNNTPIAVCLSAKQQHISHHVARTKTCTCSHQAPCRHSRSQHFTTPSLADIYHTTVLSSSA